MSQLPSNLLSLCKQFCFKCELEDNQYFLYTNNFKTMSIFAQQTGYKYKIVKTEDGYIFIFNLEDVF
jgi:hypothetical protein